jgi:hypothetical protein
VILLIHEMLECFTQRSTDHSTFSFFAALITAKHRFVVNTNHKMKWNFSVSVCNLTTLLSLNHIEVLNDTYRQHVIQSLSPQALFKQSSKRL